MRKWIGILLSLAILTGCHGSIELQKNTFTFELGKDIYANPALFLKNASSYDTESMSVKAVSNGIRKKNNRFITVGMDYLVVGEYDFKIVEGSKEYPFVVKVKDTQPPTVNTAPSEINVSVGTVIDWSNYFSASDLSGVSFSTENSFSTSSAGSVDVVLNISDRFGNTITKNVRVNIS